MKYTGYTMNAVTIYTTFPDKTSAEKTVRVLLNKKQIACANIFPVTSHFRWNKKIKKATEVAVLMKTKRALWPIVQKIILQLHPYDVPVIELMETELNTRARQWIKNSTS